MRKRPARKKSLIQSLVRAQVGRLVAKKGPRKLVEAMVAKNLQRSLKEERFSVKLTAQIHQTMRYI